MQSQVYPNVTGPPTECEPRTGMHQTVLDFLSRRGVVWLTPTTLAEFAAMGVPAAEVSATLQTMELAGDVTVATFLGIPSVAIACVGPAKPPRRTRKPAPTTNATVADVAHAHVAVKSLELLRPTELRVLIALYGLANPDTLIVAISNAAIARAIGRPNAVAPVGQALRELQDLGLLELVQPSQHGRPAQRRLASPATRRQIGAPNP